MVSYTNWSVGDTIRFCITVKDFCSTSPNFLTLGNFDIQKYGTPLTCDPWTYSCIDNSNRRVRIKSVKTYSPSSNDVKCSNLSGTIYRELGNALSDNNGIAIIEHVVTEQDRTDYLNAISDGNYYDIVFCIDDPLANIQHAKAQYTVVVNQPVITNYLDLIVEPWSWYTPEGAATEILTMVNDINGAILNFFATYGIVDYTYINTEVFTRGNNVIIRVNLTSTGLATMFPLFIKIIVLLVAVGVIIVGIGPILDWYWGETSQGLTNQQLTDAGEELIVDTADGIKDACESDITLTQDQKVNCIKNQTDNLLDKWKNYQQKVYPDADHTPLDTARNNVQQCQDTYNSSSKTTADYEAFKTCITTETDNAIGEDKDNTLEVYPGSAPAGSKEVPTDLGKLLLYAGLGIVGLVIITRK